MATQAEELEAVRVNAEPGETLDFGDSLVQPGIGDLGRPAAARAHDVMVVRSRAGNVGVLPAGQVEPLDDAELDQEIQGAEQRRSADTEMAVPGNRGQLGRGEVPIVGG